MFPCFFQAEDGIRDLVRSRGLGDVYKRQAYINLGGILEQQERYEESLVWIRKALEINPDCHLSNYNMANSLRETGDVEQAIQYYRRAVEIQPTYARACLLYTSDAADERSSGDLGGRRIIKKKKDTTTERTTAPSLRKKYRC